jgi:ubiquinone/menaquinone biosynthesis C-methylase UbiE
MIFNRLHAVPPSPAQGSMRVACIHVTVACHESHRGLQVEAGEYALMDVSEDRMWWYRALHLRLLDKLAPINGRVLDAGCGTGGLLAKLAATRPDLSLVGVEFFADGARRAAQKSRASLVRGSVNELPFADASFDAAIAADVLCHGKVEPARALIELRRVLRPDGLLVVNMPAHRWLLSMHDRRVHNVLRQSAPEVLAMLRAAGFTNARAAYWNTLLLPLMIAQRKLLARRENAASDVAPFPPWLDAILYAITALERRLPFRLPSGGSVLATARRHP